MKRIKTQSSTQKRKGSTLLIVLSLLGLLAFTGMVFYTFAAQERSAADFFSEAAKDTIEEPDDPFPFALKQILTGATRDQKNSIVWDAQARFSMVNSVVGNNTVPRSDAGIHVIYDGGLPVVDNDFNGAGDFGILSQSADNPMNMVGSLVAWASKGVDEDALFSARGPNGAFPGLGVDYTYPDINNMFLAYRGWAIRDNGAAALAGERFERVPVFIPSFMRPALLKSSATNGVGANNTPTDLDWFDHSAHAAYSLRSFRPSALHIAGLDANGNTVRRFIDATHASDSGLVSTYGAFPLRPSEDVNTAEFGRLGLFTGHLPGTADAPDADNFRLDQDNDGDGIFEGIWLDLGYPIQETADGDLYATIHSFTVYDLASLIDLNAHGNLAELNRTETVLAQVAGGAGSSDMSTTSLSASNQGLGPNEVNPVWGLLPPSVAAATNSEFAEWFGAAPTNRLEQANMEYLWLTTGRIDSANVVHDGKWGDANALWYHRHGDDGSSGSDGAFAISTLPRPGRSGDLVTSSSQQISFGGFLGFDDNGNALDGVASTYTGRTRGFVHMLDVGGTGSTFQANPLLPSRFMDPVATTSKWLQYSDYSLVGSPGNFLNETKYIGGRDQDPTAAADNLLVSPRYNASFEDALEVLLDTDFAVRPDDSILAPGDLIPAHLSAIDTAAATGLSTRLSNLAVSAFGAGSNVSDRFTTLSNLLRSIPYQHDLGGGRAWETSADSDGDGRLEFPPTYGQNAFSASDPFRPEVRRLLTSEVGEPNKLITQLPLSLNHILDVFRTEETPAVGTPEYLNYLRRVGMRFRPLTEHPMADETDGAGREFADVTSIPQVGTTAGDTALTNFPPKTFEDREFWARRDRQKLARDIYVLLYTVGGTTNALADNSTNAVYSDRALRRMAHFAANMVDAMDSDHVATVFEYDKNLSDGWQLDDDPFTNNPAENTGPGTDDGLYPLDDSARGVVMGVEAQSLSFSEALAVRLEDFAKYNNTSDDPTTQFNDLSQATQLADPDIERRDRYVLHIELQNNQPYVVDLSVDGVTGTTNGQQAIWQLARVDRTTAHSANAGDPSDAVQLTTLSPVAHSGGADGAVMNFMDGNAAINGGERFSVSMATASNTSGTDSLRADPLGTGTADLYLQKPGQSDYVLISPDKPGVTSASSGVPQCSLDTISSAHDSRYIYDDNSSEKGRFLADLPYTASGVGYYGNEAYNFTPTLAENRGTTNSGQGIEIALRRRQNPNLPLLPLDENPWVEVDRIRVVFKDLFTFAANMGNLESTPRFNQIRSSERTEPLGNLAVNNRHPAANADPLVDDFRYNTIVHDSNRLAGINDATGAGGFNLWQPHFDRHFASPVELFHLPVVGPRFLTARLDRMRHSPVFQTSVAEPIDVSNNADTDGNPDLVGSAAAIFLQPDVLPTGFDVDDNAWYRLLQFVEVPSRVNTMLGNYINRRRLPGRINLNGIRHIDVYAGLIDEPFFSNISLRKLPGHATDMTLDEPNQYAPFMISGDSTITGDTTIDVVGGTATLTGYRDRWFEFLNERDGMTPAYDPNNAIANTQAAFWIPGTPNAKPFRSVGHLRSTVGAAHEQSILRPHKDDIGMANQHRHWLELGDPAGALNAQTTHREKQQILSKIYNNTSTASDAFIVYGTAAYFRAYQDPSGLFRVGGRMGLDLDGNGTEEDDAGWEKRAVFVIDRSEIINAFDERTGSFDWQRLIRVRADLPSDSK